MTVLQFAMHISIREGFQTFLSPKATLMTTAAARARGPSILIAGTK
jgi:hypothetical protein